MGGALDLIVARCDLRRIAIEPVARPGITYVACITCSTQGSQGGMVDVRVDAEVDSPPNELHAVRCSDDKLCQYSVAEAEDCPAEAVARPASAC